MDPSHLDLTSALESELGSGTLDERAAFAVLNRPLPLNEGTAASYMERRARAPQRLVECEASGDPGHVSAVLQPILGATFGVLLYREQILALAYAVCEFDSNELRQLWLSTATLSEGPEATQFGRAFVNRRVSPWTKSEAARVWHMIVDAAPIVMAAGDVYRAAARSIADERINELWPMNLDARVRLDA
jgi:hypothetical protein